MKSIKSSLRKNGAKFVNEAVTTEFMTLAAGAATRLKTATKFNVQVNMFDHMLKGQFKQSAVFVFKMKNLDLDSFYYTNHYTGGYPVKTEVCLGLTFDGTFYQWGLFSRTLTGPKQTEAGPIVVLDSIESDSFEDMEETIADDVIDTFGYTVKFRKCLEAYVASLQEQAKIEKIMKNS